MAKKPAVNNGVARFVLKSGAEITVYTTRDLAEGHIEGIRNCGFVRMEMSDGGFSFLRYDELAAYTFTPEA